MYKLLVELASFFKETKLPHILYTEQYNVLYIALLLYTLLFTLYRWVLKSAHNAPVRSI